MGGDFYFLVDQARDMLLAKQIVVNHTQMLIGARAGFGGLFHGPAWIYMITPFFMLSAGDPYYSLVPLFLLVSISIVVAGSIFVGRLYGAGYGLLMCLLLAISYPLVSVVPFSTNAQVMPLICVLYLFFLIRFIRGSNNSMIFMALFMGLGFQFESAFAILFLPITLLTIIVRNKRVEVKKVLISILFLFIPVVNFIFFELRHRFLMTSSVINLITKHQDPLKGYEKYSAITYRIWDRFFLLINSYKINTFRNDLLSISLILLIIAFGFGIVVVKIYKAKKISQENKEFLLIFSLPVLIFSVYILYPFPLWEHYLLPLTIVIALIICVSIKEVFATFLGKVLIVLFLISMLSPVFVWLKGNYIGSTVNELDNSDGSFLNQLKVVKWVVNDADNEKFGYFVKSSQTFTYGMDYLVWWYSQKNKTVQYTNKKEHLSYLISYPTDLGAYNFWREHVIRTHEQAIYFRNFRGGIFVEKVLFKNSEAEPDSNYYQNLIFR